HLDREGDIAARLEVDAEIADESLHGPNDGGDRVVQVELHDLGSGAVARVAHAKAENRTAVGADRLWSLLELRPLEARVADAVPERVRRGRVDVRDTALSGERSCEVGRRLGARRGRHAHGQAAARVDASAEHAGDRVGSLLAGEE